MTRHSDFKHLVRARMAATGENYTAARAALLGERSTAPERLIPVPVERSPAAHGRDGDRPPSPDPFAARADHERLIRPFLRDGVLTQIPSRRRARLAVLLELLSRFPVGEVLTEKEVGETLRPLHEDVAYLRRELVEYGLLERDNLGSYWVARRPPERTGNMSQEVSDWERVWLPRFLSGELGTVR